MALEVRGELVLFDVIEVDELFHQVLKYYCAALHHLLIVEGAREQLLLLISPLHDDHSLLREQELGYFHVVFACVSVRGVVGLAQGIKLLLSPGPLLLESAMALHLQLLLC